MTVIEPAGTPTIELTPQPARRLRGLRPPVLPSGPLLAQLSGALAVLVGLYLLVAALASPVIGLAVTLIVGGVAATALGALREAGKI